MTQEQRHLVAAQAADAVQDARIHPRDNADAAPAADAPALADADAKQEIKTAKDNLNKGRT
jgi:hypothetical protein